MADPYKLTRAAVILDGGPRSGAVYYADDIAGQRAAAQAMGRAFDYRPTRRRQQHPVVTDSEHSRLTVWEWVPNVAAWPPAGDDPAAPANVCPDCGEPTLTARDVAGHRIDLAAYDTPEGTHVIDGDGIARHRRRADLVDPDSRGRSPHRCPPPARLPDE